MHRNTFVTVISETSVGFANDYDTSRAAMFVCTNYSLCVYINTTLAAY